MHHSGSSLGMINNHLTYEQLQTCGGNGTLWARSESSRKHQHQFRNQQQQLKIIFFFLRGRKRVDSVQRVLSGLIDTVARRRVAGGRE